jgi:hypothetical protein
MEDFESFGKNIRFSRELFEVIGLDFESLQSEVEIKSCFEIVLNSVA